MTKIFLSGHRANRRRWLLALVAIAFIGGSTQAEAGNGATLHLCDMREWTVVVGDDAIPSERYAAEEFCRLFRATTGSELKAAAAPGGRGSIYIGESPALRAHPLGFSVAELGEEGLRIRITLNAVVIAGGRPRGTLYGVYEFFERYLGVRFLTKDDTHIPADAATLAIPLADYQYVPPFSFRYSYYQENHVAPEFATRLRVNTVTKDERLGGQTAQQLISHSLEKYLPVARYGHAHPEYYALVNGVRKLGTENDPPQVCSLNPDVIRIVTDAVEQELIGRPSLVNISVSPMDNDDFCQCPACDALSAQEGSTAAPHLVLVNAVAERIAQTHPGVRVGTLVYWHTRNPPKILKLLPNVEIQLCSIECCILHPLDDPDCNRNRVFMEDFARWRSICQNIWIWNYNTNFSNYDLPFPNFNSIAKNVQTFRNSGALGVFMQAAGNGLSTEMSDLRNYVMSRCLWQPAQESWALVDEFCRLHYGAAAPPILDYLRFLHQNAEMRGLHPRCFAHAPIELGLDRVVAQRIYSYFQKALALAPDNTIRSRVEKASIPALRTLLATAPLLYDNGRYRLDSSDIGSGIFDRYVTLAKKFGMNRVAETRELGLYLDELRDIFRGVPAVILEDKVWRMVLLPEQNGHVAELIYKPTGRNLVESPVAGFTRWDVREPWPRVAQGGTSAGGPRHVWTSNDRQVVMTRTQSDGSVWRRTVSLPADSTGQIRVQAEFTAGSGHTGWQVRERPANYFVSGSDDPSVVSIYTKDTIWNQANRDWRFERKNPLQFQVHPSSQVQAIAFYDHSEHFGVEQIFEPDGFPRLQVYWSPGRQLLTLDMLAPVTPMKPEQRFSFAYEISYLKQPPVDH